jgi:diadenylate cyclase
LREGLEHIVRSESGALILIVDRPEVMEIAEGGFRLNADFSPAKLYELAKMDGSIILDQEIKKILAANTQLVPDLGIPSNETGIRHRTAERVARQTNAMVISISERRGVITIYRGSMKYVLRDLEVIFTKANQALQTLEKYRAVLDKVLTNLSITEFEDTVTMYEVCKVIQRMEMTNRVVREIRKYIVELGTEGRLITMQLEELVSNVESEGLLVIQDYSLVLEAKSARQIMNVIESWSSEDLLDLPLIARVLGYTGGSTIVEHDVSSRGFRILSKIPRLPVPVIENLVLSFDSLNRILNATLEELDEVEGIGETRARSIKEGLSRYWNQLLQERYR